MADNIRLLDQIEDNNQSLFENHGYSIDQRCFRDQELLTDQRHFLDQIQLTDQRDLNGQDNCDDQQSYCETDLSDSPLLHPVFAEMGTEKLPFGISSHHKVPRHLKNITKPALKYESSKIHLTKPERLKESNVQQQYPSTTNVKNKIQDANNSTTLLSPDYQVHTCERGAKKRTSIVVSDESGKFRIIVKKTKSKLGIAIEGGVDTNHRLPRIINISPTGAAFEAGGLRVGQILLEMDNHKLEGKPHDEIARTISNLWLESTSDFVEFVVIDRKPSSADLRRSSFSLLSQVT